LVRCMLYYSFRKENSMGKNKETTIPLTRDVTSSTKRTPQSRANYRTTKTRFTPSLEFWWSKGRVIGVCPNTSICGRKLSSIGTLNAFSFEGLFRIYLQTAELDSKRTSG